MGREERSSWKRPVQNPLKERAVFSISFSILFAAITRCWPVLLGHPECPSSGDAHQHERQQREQNPWAPPEMLVCCLGKKLLELKPARHMPEKSSAKSKQQKATPERKEKDDQQGKPVSQVGNNSYPHIARAIWRKIAAITAKKFQALRAVCGKNVFDKINRTSICQMPVLRGSGKFIFYQISKGMTHPVAGEQATKKTAKVPATGDC